MEGQNTGKAPVGNIDSIDGSDESRGFCNDESLGAGEKQLIEKADEYAYLRYGIGAADIICGGDLNEFFAKWYDEGVGIEGIQRLIDERSDKYDLTDLNVPF